MVEGWITAKFSTIFKGYRALCLKARRNSRKLYRLLKVLNLAFKNFVDKTERHFVTKSLRIFDNIIKNLERAEEKEYKIADDVELMEDRFLTDLEKDEGRYEGRVENLLKKAAESGQAGIVKIVLEIEDMFYKMWQRVLARLKQEKGEENTYLLNLVKEAQKGGKRTFLANLRSMVKEKETFFARFIENYDIKGFKNEAIASLKIFDQIFGIIDNVVSDLRQLMIYSKARKETPKRAALIRRIEAKLEKLKQLITINGKYIEDAFYKDFLAFKRDLIFTLQTLMLLDKVKDTSEFYALVKGYLPKETVLKKGQELEAIEAHINEHFHTIAQGFRILWREEGHLEQKVEMVDKEIKALGDQLRRKLPAAA